MDTVTHALVGAAISDSWFRSRLGKWSTPFSLALGALPDIDVVTRLISFDYFLTHHRGITHSFLPQILVTPLLGYIGYRLAKRGASLRSWLILTILCLSSHTLFDLMTSWGTMPMLPLSAKRISWDVVPVFDALILFITASSFTLNRFFRRRRSGNITASDGVHDFDSQYKPIWIARFALVLLALYVFLGWEQNRRTVQQANDKLANMGITVEEIRALPIMFTHFAWEVAARDSEGNIYNAVYSSFANGPMRFLKIEGLSHKELAPILATPDGRLVAWYTQGMYVGSRETNEDGSRYLIQDRRFFALNKPEQSRFEMEFTESPSGTGFSSRLVRMGARNVNVKEEFLALWNLTWQGRDMKNTIK